MDAEARRSPAPLPRRPRTIMLAMDRSRSLEAGGAVAMNGTIGAARIGQPPVSPPASVSSTAAGGALQLNGPDRTMSAEGMCRRWWRRRGGCFSRGRQFFRAVLVGGGGAGGGGAGWRRAWRCRRRRGRRGRRQQSRPRGSWRRRRLGREGPQQPRLRNRRRTLQRQRRRRERLAQVRLRNLLPPPRRQPEEWRLPQRPHPALQSAIRNPQFAIRQSAIPNPPSAFAQQMVRSEPPSAQNALVDRGKSYRIAVIRSPGFISDRADRTAGSHRGRGRLGLRGAGGGPGAAQQLAGGQPGEPGRQRIWPLHPARQTQRRNSSGGNFQAQSNGYVDAQANAGELPPRTANYDNAAQNQASSPGADGLESGRPATGGRRERLRLSSQRFEPEAQPERHHHWKLHQCAASNRRLFHRRQYVQSISGAGRRECAMQNSRRRSARPRPVNLRTSSKTTASITETPKTPKHPKRRASRANSGA